MLHLSGELLKHIELPREFQMDLKKICQTKSLKANKVLNETFGINQNEGVQCVELSIAPADFAQAKDKEDYVLRNAENVTKWKTLKMDDIFEPLPDTTVSPRSTLVLAGPGMGKTTVTQQRAFQWGSGTSELSGTQSLFRFQCRDFKSMIADKVLTSLTDLLFKIHGPNITSEDETNIILKLLDNSKTEIIFDGLDELDSSTMSHEGNSSVCDANFKTSIPNLIYNLKEGNLLPSARILFSSRPTNKITLKDFNRVIVILGFSKTSISKCMMNLCKGDNDKHQFIMSHIEQTQLCVHCFVPLTCVILGIVLLHSYHEASTDQGSPHAEHLNRFTHLYIHVTLQLLSKLFEREDSNWNMYKLPTMVKESLCSLIKLATSGMFAPDRKLVFNAEDLDAHDITSYIIKSGILECSSEYKPHFLYGQFQKTVASFVHLSHQEFLAATSLAVYWDDKLLENAMKDQSTGRYDMILLYTAGLLGDKTMGHKFLKSIEPSLNSEHLSARSLQLIKKMYEVFKASDEANKKTTKVQMLMCLAEGRIESPVFATDPTLDLSLIPQGLLPHQLVAVSYHLKYNTITEIK